MVGKRHDCNLWKTPATLVMRLLLNWKGSLSISLSPCTKNVSKCFVALINLAIEMLGGTSATLIHVSRPWNTGPTQEYMEEIPDIQQADPQPPPHNPPPNDQGMRMETFLRPPSSLWIHLGGAVLASSVGNATTAKSISLTYIYTVPAEINQIINIILTSYLGCYCKPTWEKRPDACKQLLKRGGQRWPRRLFRVQSSGLMQGVQPEREDSPRYKESTAPRIGKW